MDLDVLIIGAGAAGSTAALTASKNGKKTMIIEKNDRIGYKERKIDITESTHISEIIDKLNLRYLDTATYSAWHSENEKTDFISKVKDVFFLRGQDNDSIEVSSINQAKKYGAQVFTSVKITNIEKSHKINKVTFQTNDQTITVAPKTIIDTTGNARFISNLHGATTTEKYTLAGYGITFNTITQEKPHTDIFLSKKYFPGGYFFYANVQGRSVACGVVNTHHSTKNNLVTSVDKFIQEIVSDKKTNIRYFSGIGKISKPKESEISNVLLAGEAGGFIDPLLGYGLNYAIYSGYWAAELASKNDNTTIAKKEYAKKMEVISKTINDGYWLRNIFDKLTDKDFDRAISFVNKLKKEKDLDEIIEKPHRNLTAIIKAVLRKPGCLKLIRHVI